MFSCFLLLWICSLQCYPIVNCPNVPCAMLTRFKKKKGPRLEVKTRVLPIWCCHFHVRRSNNYCRAAIDGLVVDRRTRVESPSMLRVVAGSCTSLSSPRAGATAYLGTTHRMGDTYLRQSLGRRGANLSGAMGGDVSIRSSRDVDT